MPTGMPGTFPAMSTEKPPSQIINPLKNTADRKMEKNADLGLTGAQKSVPATGPGLTISLFLKRCS